MCFLARDISCSIVPIERRVYTVIFPETSLIHDRRFRKPFLTVYTPLFSIKVYYCVVLAGLFSFLLLVMTLISNGQKPLDLVVNRPEAGFTSIFCRQTGQVFFVASMWRDECRHSEQKRWPVCFLSVSQCGLDGRGGEREKETYHNA